MKKQKFLIRSLTMITFLGFFTSCGNDQSSDSSNNREGESFFSRTFGMGTSSKELKAKADDISTAIKDLSADNRLLNPELVKEFYQTRDHAGVWTGEDARESFSAEMEAAEEDGLFPEDYHFDQLSSLRENPTNLDRDEQADLEVLMTDAYLQYAQDLYYGKLDPADYHEIWGVDRQEKDLAKHLQDAVADNSISNALDELRPNHAIYGELQAALEEYRELKEGEVPFTKVPEGENIEPGQRDERITAVADRLKQLDFLDENYSPQENKYDEDLQAAIRKFQEERRLQIDKILGNTTIKELNMSPTDRYNQILANLERWRWYPRDLGAHYILINIPDFKLAVVKDGDTVRTHSVIAGTQERPTPIFSDSLQYIVLNPEWTIPYTIKKEDIIPSAANNSDYLSNNNIRIVSKDGETVDPSTVDWESDEAMSYTYVQKAGPSNPLGRVKIIYPNDYAIYLHDTPAKSLFEENERAESSGCVRVEGALDLADYVTGDDVRREQINQILSSGRTRQLAIKSPIRVHHFYWTTWRDNGETIFAEDVYDLDRKIYSALLEH